MNTDDPGPVIAVIGDLHGNTIWAQEAVKRVAGRGIKTIVQVGDFGIWPGTSGKTYIRRLNEALIEHDMNLYFVDGNHEDHDWLDSLPVKNGLQAIHPGRRSSRTHPTRIYRITRGHRWEWYGKMFCGLGGAVSADQQWRRLKVDWWPQESIDTVDVAHTIEGGKVDYMFTHDCPSGVNLEFERVQGVSDSVDRQSENNRDALQVVAEAIQPSFWYHGHFHMYHRKVVTFNGNPCLVVGLDRDLSRFNTNIEYVRIGNEKI